MKHAAAIHSVPVKLIAVGDRHRRDMGDLQDLAASIERDGLLQPIGITEDNVLVFGERRLRSVRDVLKRDTIEARIVRLVSILDGEYAENELRKDFTPSERVAIADAVKAEIGKKRGGDRRSDQFQKIGNENSDDIEARRSGFGNPETLRQARKVVEKAVEEVKAKMDSGDISVSAASKLADHPPAEQKRIAELPKPEMKQAVKNLQPLPSPSAARKIAIATGKPTAASNNTYVLPMSKQEEDALGHRQNEMMAIVEAAETLAQANLMPAQMADLSRRFNLVTLAKNAPMAVDWLTRFLGEVEHERKRSSKAV